MGLYFWIIGSVKGMYLWNKWVCIFSKQICIKTLSPWYHINLSFNKFENKVNKNVEVVDNNVDVGGSEGNQISSQSIKSNLVHARP